VFDCGRTYGQKDVQTDRQTFFTGFIRSSLRRWPNKLKNAVQYAQSCLCISVTRLKTHAADWSSLMADCDGMWPAYSAPRVLMFIVNDLWGHLSSQNIKSNETQKETHNVSECDTLTAIMVPVLQCLILTTCPHEPWPRSPIRSSSLTSVTTFYNPHRPLPIVTAYVVFSRVQVQVQVKNSVVPPLL